jgi:choline dehydrogenase
MNPSLHGTSGPIQSSFPKGTGPLDQAWGATFKTLGLGPTSDPRSGNILGGYAMPKFQDKMGKRSYAAPAYYLPNAGRSNLTVLTGAFVKKIELDTQLSPVIATGVWYSIAGQDHFVHARKEIIVSAGTIQSPQILELSGIGSKSHLEKFGVDAVLDNAGVGENLQVSSILPFSNVR